MVMMMVGEIVSELVAGELVDRQDPVDDPAFLENREVPVRGALRQIAALDDLGCGEGAIGAGEDVDQGAPTRRVALIEIVQTRAHERLEAFGHEPSVPAAPIRVARAGRDPEGRLGPGACDDGCMATAADPQLLETAVDFLRQAGELTLRYFRNPEVAVESKGDGTPVTVADRGAERLLRELIEAEFPDDGILGEEEAEKTGTSGRRWIIDPIDGTKAFTHGVPLYSNLLAIEDADGIGIGVINLPALGETVYAGRGLGCFLNGEPASVNDRSEIPGSYLTCSGLTRWEPEQFVAAKSAGLHIRTWGDGFGYSLVATGRVEAMFDPIAELYDLAPMPVILSEAGGRFSDGAGRPGPDGGSGLATNGRFHEELLELLVN